MGRVMQGLQAHTATTHASLMFYSTELSEETMQTPVEIDFQDMVQDLTSTLRLRSMWPTWNNDMVA